MSLTRTFETSRPEPQSDWPESWRVSHRHDEVEIWGAADSSGYSRMYDQRRQRVLDALEGVAVPGAKLLDLAAGQGNYSLAATAMGYDVTWNDLRADLIDYVRLKSPLAKQLDFHPGNIFDVGDAFADRFDVALALEVIEHVAHPDEFLAQLSKVVRPGGHIILSTPNGGYFLNRLPRFSDCINASVFESGQFKPDSDGHIFLLHQDEICKLSHKAGLKMIRHEIFTNPLSAGQARTRHLLGILPDWSVEGLERITAGLPLALRRKLCTASLTVLRRPD